MALRKPYSDEFGSTHPASYWRLNGFAIELGAGSGGSSATITVLGWKDEAAFLAGKVPVSRRSIVLTGPLLNAFLSTPSTGPTLAADLRRAVYAAVRARDAFFDDAEDLGGA